MRLSKGKTNRITRQRLKQQRGWTPRLMEKFLPEPIEKVVNPNYKSGPPILLFDLRRIKRIESTKKFQKALAVTAPRKNAAMKGVATKEAKTQKMVENLQYIIKKMPRKELAERACNSYNAN